MASGQTASQTSSSTGFPYDGPSSGRRRDVHIAGSASGKIVSGKASDTRAGGKTGDNGGGGVSGGELPSLWGYGQQDDRSRRVVYISRSVAQATHRLLERRSREDVF